MATTATRMTAKEYYAMTTEVDSTQLVEGELVVNEPKAIHARLQGRLYRALMSWVDAAPGRGEAFLPTDVRMDEHNVYGPDLLWFSQQALAAAFPDGLDAYPARVPDLCVEIRSQGTWRHDIGAKKRVYESRGLPELWLVDDAAETVLVYRRSSGSASTFDVALELEPGEALTSPMLAGFELPVGELFAS